MDKKTINKFISILFSYHYIPQPNHIFKHLILIEILYNIVATSS